jgi:carboxyl-terminal processing protease
MKYLYFKILFLRLFIGVNLFGQTKTTNIEIYSKVWGFIKYHHPAIASGHINWDSVYIAHIDKAIAAKNTAALNIEIKAILNAAGAVKPTDPIKLPGNLFTINHDLKWLYTSTLITKQNREKLQFIYNNRNQGNNRFIKYNNQSDFSGENQYENMSSPTVEYRLLFLSRFWNVINYFDPYKYLIGEDWGRVLDRLIPKFIAVNNTLSYYKALLELSVSLHNGHSFLSIAENDTTINNLVYGQYTAPFYPEIVKATAIVRKYANDSLCSKANIVQGDIILEIDGIPVYKKIKQMQAYVSGSNRISQNRIIGWRLFDTHLSYEKLKIKRGRRIIETSVKCVLTKSKNWVYINNYTASQTGYKTIGNSIAYIYAAQIQDKNLDTIRKIIMNSKATIFDVRNYPGQNAFFKIMGIMLPKATYIDYATIFMPDNPGMFKWMPSNKIGGVNPDYYKGTTIILVDERSLSQGEYSAMVLQTIPGSVTVGSQTAGADGAVSPVPMGSKITIGYSGYGEYYPDKTPTQRRGVKIDIPVKRTVTSTINEQDVALEAAMKYLKGKCID